MPKHEDIQKILVIGSGPVIIGQSGELDQASAQACDALRSMGYDLIIAHSDPAAVITDLTEKDQVYIEPLDVDNLTQIIALEKPDAVLATVGGQTALNLTADLAEKNILSSHNVRLLGLTLRTLQIAVNKKKLNELLFSKGIEHSQSFYADSSLDAMSYAEKLGFPVIVRPVMPTPGLGNKIAYNVEELEKAANTHLSNPCNQQIIVEESLFGAKEMELIIVRDSDGKKVSWGVLESLDPVGIHHHDSVVTLPPQDIAPELIEKMEHVGKTLADELAVVGMISLRFAYDAESDRLLVLNVSAKASRSSSLASIATGIPIHSTMACLAGGMSINEMPWQSLAKDPIDRLKICRTIVKFPYWSFDTFQEVYDHLDTHMQSVGEVIGIGDNFNMAFQKALRSLGKEPVNSKLAVKEASGSFNKLPSRTDYYTSQRYFHIHTALCLGESIETLSQATQISPFFLSRLKELVDIEKEIMSQTFETVTDELLTRAKLNGFSDTRLTSGLDCSIESIQSRYDQMKNDGATHEPLPLTPYPQIARDRGRDVYLILGPGPDDLGFDLGFDHSSVHAARAIYDAGYGVVRVNCNPASITTANDRDETVYMSALNLEDVAHIYSKEKVNGIFTQFSGSRIASQATLFSKAGLKVLGNRPDTDELLNNRGRFRNLINELGIAQPEFKRVEAYPELFLAADKIGYPLLIRSESKSSSINANQPLIVMDAQTLKQNFSDREQSLLPQALIVERFFEHAIECEVNALADGKDAFIPAVLEHIELAGVHSADSACVTPTYSTPLRHVETMHAYTQKIVKKLEIKGLLNVQFAVLNDTVYVLDASPWASRNLPWLSKTCNIPMAYKATQILLGKSLGELGLESFLLPHFSLREAVFPFAHFLQVDPLLGPTARSTGSVMSLADSFGLAYFKAQQAILNPLPFNGTVLITVSDMDKPSILEPARLFKEMGFNIKATKGTQTFLADYGIASDGVRKLGFGRPNLVDAIKTGEIDLVINTPSGKESQIDDSDIRKAAILHKVPNITTPAGALAAAKGISARLKGKPKVKPLGRYHLRLK